MDLKRLLIDRMENRILVGITMFLGTMVLVGWVAINETGRMASFQQQHLARSIEHGAELYASNCATCHGPDGLGTARAPALNNPHLFGHDFLAEINTQITVLETARAQFENLTTSLEDTELSAEEIAALEDQLGALTEEFGENPAETIDEQITALQAEIDAASSQMGTAIERGYDPDAPSRLESLGWSGTLQAFVHTTLVSGRPVSTSYWPEPMPAWSQTAGGPLREDQLENLTNYVLNWGTNRDWTLEDLMAVNQFAKVPVEGEGAVAEGAVAPDIANIQSGEIEGRREEIDTAMEAVMTQIESEGLVGDPVNGQTLYNGGLACSSCHNVAAIAPPTDGTYTRTVETRLQDPALEGYTPEHYLIESILVPNAYIAPTYPANAMPQNFGERLTAQELADIVAYLESYDGPDPLAE